MVDFLKVAKSTTIVFFCWICSAMACQQPQLDKNDSLIDQALETVLYSKFACFGDGASDISACNFFVGKSVHDVFGVPDFWLPDANRYMTTAEMVEWLPGGVGPLGWKRIGNGDDRDAHRLAADAAKNGQATIALWNPTGGVGHVALVLPGLLRDSGPWGIPVVRSAQTSLNSIGDAFVGCRISAGFGPDKQSNVVFWTKGI